MVGAPFCMFIKAWEFSHATRKLVISSPSFFGFWTEVFCTMPFLPLPIPEPFDAPWMRIYQQNEQCQEQELSTNNTLMEYPWLSRIMKHCSWMFWVQPILGDDDEQLLQNTEYMIIFPFLMAAHLLGRWMVCGSGHKDLPKVWAAKKGAGWSFRKERTTRCARFMFCLWGIWHITLFGAVEMI